MLTVAGYSDDKFQGASRCAQGLTFCFHPSFLLLIDSDIFNMRRFILLFALLVTFPSFCQITPLQQKALNSYVDYANQSAEEVSATVKSIIAYYPTIHQKSSWGTPRFTCPVQLDEYYWNTAAGQTKSLPPAMSSLANIKLKDLRAAAEKIDAACKALDTYHKLEDYKKDDFAKALTLISELQILVADYRKKQNALQAELESGYKKLTAASAQNPYHKAEEMMRAQVA